MWWFQRGLCALPGALVIWSSDTFLISYATAVVLGHADILIPYISDTGTEVSERCVFGFMLSISAFSGNAVHLVLLSSVFCQGVLVQNHLFILFSETVSVMFFYILPENSYDISIHLLGAGLTFGAGTLYVLVQTGMSYRMQPRFHGRDIFWACMAVGMWSLIIFISSVLMYDDLPGVDVANKFHWQPRERGFLAHQVSAAAEWSLAFSFICFFLTYIHDFQFVCHNLLYNVEHVQHGERSPLLAGAM
uniref:DNA-damage regulated autophagy modulator 2a n=1 Tax=Sinocyclocheilus rhinocerous TaxID=307959 RepID=A0A673MQN7_9TELE